MVGPMSVRHTPTQSPFANLKLTRGAKILLGVVVTCSVAFLLCSLETRARILEWTLPTGTAVFRQGRVWTLLTGPLIERDIIWLVLLTFIMMSQAPMEEFWGTRRMLRFAALTAVAGSIGAAVMSLILGNDFAVLGGISALGFALQLAFGMVYYKTPMSLMGAINITGRHLVIGTVGLAVAFVVLQGRWVQAGAFGGAMGMAFWLTSKRYNPRVLWTRWQLRRSRAHLSLVPLTGTGRAAEKPGVGKKRAKTNERYLN